MSGVNKAILIGRLGKDPEVRHLESGVAVASFPIATSETYKDRNTGEKVEQTEWHNIVLWRGLAEVAEKYLHKGDMVYIEGKIRTRSWEKEGVVRYTTEIVGDNMNMLTPRSEQSGANSGTTGTQNYAEPTQSAQKVEEPSVKESQEDDLPF